MQQWCWRDIGWALAMGVVAAMAVAGRDLPDLVTSLPGYFNDDAAHGIYLHHQFHDAVLAGRWSLFDPNQFFPTGYHPAHTNGGNSLEMVVSGILRLALPWPAWLSAAALAWIPLNVIAFMPLGRRLWGSGRTAALVGAAWAILPPMMGQLAAGRLTQVALVGLPLATAGFLGIAERGGRREIGLAGVGLALTGLGYWFNALFFVILTPIFVLHGGRIRGWRPAVRDTMLAGGLALGLVAPFLLIVFWPTLTGGWMPGTHIDPRSFSPVFSDALHLTGEQASINSGWLPWVLVPGLIWTALRGRRPWLWLSLTLCAVVFALGPAEQLDERIWRLPYYPLWQWVPGLARMVHPERWLLVGGLFGVIAAADAAVRWRAWMAAVLPVGVLIQLWVAGNLPLGSWAPEMPDHWAHVAASSTEGAIVSVPIGQSQNTVAHQPFHGRPLLGGMLEDQIWTIPPEQMAFIEDSLFLRGLKQLSRGRDVFLVLGSADLEALRTAGFSTVVWDAAAWRRVRAGPRSDPVKNISKVLGPPVFQGADGAVWDLPR